MLTVTNWTGLPPAPFDVRFELETVTVVEVDDYRLTLASPVVWLHDRGETGQVITDQRGAPRFCGEDPDKIEEEMGDILEAEDPFTSGGKGKKGRLKGWRRKMLPPSRDDTLYDL